MRLTAAQTVAHTALVVERDPHVASVLARFLERRGWVTLIAYDGASGVVIARDTAIGLVLLDLALPFLSGIEVCRQIRAAGLDVVIFVVSTLDSITDRLSAFEAGADDFIGKPADLRELAARVDLRLRYRPAGSAKALVACGSTAAGRRQFIKAQL